MRDNEWVITVLQWFLLGLLCGIGIFFVSFCITIGYRAADGMLHSESSTNF
jgi:hypothetical protein